MRYFKCIVEYDGTNYSGWQRQANTPLTIQEKIEDVLKVLVKKPVQVLAASRTDAGVHAYGQVIGFGMESSIPVERLPFAMNSLLPDDIRIRQAKETEKDFHPRFLAKGKIYNYYLDNCQIPSVFNRFYAYHVSGDLDIDAMRQGSLYLNGTHDFSSFRAVGCSAKSPIKTLKRVKIEVEKNHLIRLEFEGDGFLYNMVRILAGTLIYVGRGKIFSSDVKDILLAKDRNLAGPTAPAHGLFLMKVFYDEK